VSKRECWDGDSFGFGDGFTEKANRGGWTAGHRSETASEHISRAAERTPGASRAGGEREKEELLIGSSWVGVSSNISGPYHFVTRLCSNSFSPALSSFFYIFYSFC
jgi:hypothetical protein